MVYFWKMFYRNNKIEMFFLNFYKLRNLVLSCLYNLTGAEWSEENGDCLWELCKGKLLVAKVRLSKSET